MTRVTKPFPDGYAGQDGRYWAQTSAPFDGRRAVLTTNSPQGSLDEAVEPEKWLI
jgi:hypothetical protein